MSTSETLAGLKEKVETLRGEIARVRGCLIALCTENSEELEKADFRVDGHSSFTHDLAFFVNQELQSTEWSCSHILTVLERAEKRRVRGCRVS